MEGACGGVGRGVGLGVRAVRGTATYAGVGGGGARQGSETLLNKCDRHVTTKQHDGWEGGGGLLSNITKLSTHTRLLANN